jgi:hypothetical protein
VAAAAPDLESACIRQAIAATPAAKTNPWTVRDFACFDLLILTTQPGPDNLHK